MQPPRVRRNLIRGLRWSPSPRVESIGTWPALLRSFGELAVGEGAARLLGIAAVLLLVRRLELDEFGIVMLGVTLTVWFSLVVDSGTETLGMRDVSRRPERLREIAEPILGLRLAVSAGAMVVFPVIAFVVASGDWILLSLFALVLPANALNLRMMVVGVRATKAIGLGNVASQLVFLVGVLALVNGGHDVVWVPVLKAVGELAYAAVVLAAVRRRFGPVRPRIDLAAWSTTLRASVPLFVNSLARAAMLSLGVVLTGLLLVRHQLGFYAAAQRPVVLAAAATGLFLVSFLASYSAADRQESLNLFRRTARLGAAAIPVALAVSAASDPLVRLLYGASYAPAAPVLGVLIWIVPVLLLGGPYGLVLIAEGLQGRLMWSNILGAVFTLAATFAVIPSAGILGAAVVAVAGQALVFALNYRTSVGLGLAPTLAVVLFGRSKPARSLRTVPASASLTQGS